MLSRLLSLLPVRLLAQLLVRLLSRLLALLLVGFLALTSPARGQATRDCQPLAKVAS